MNYLSIRLKEKSPDNSFSPENDNNNPNYPNDHNFTSSEIADNVITVGALAPSYGSNMVATFS
ncbi:MAG: hypothetical protein AAGI38_23190, partial [Bacteroidota bacterium]